MLLMGRKLAEYLARGGWDMSTNNVCDIKDTLKVQY